jgi:predicted alpha/beta hydrolase
MNSSEPRLVQDLWYQDLVVPHRGETLHLQRIFSDRTGPAIFMLHGSLGNGRVFYSQSAKGLAPYLARQGFDTFVGDLRGRGRSRPVISAASRYGQTESIRDEIPALHRAVVELRPRAPLFWAAHSWGGALLISALARNPTLFEGVRGGVFFGSKRVIHRDTLLKRFVFTPVWDGMCRLLVHCCGYLSGKWIKFSDDCETKKSYIQTARWLIGEPWIDDDDGFDYLAALREVEQPPILYLCGTKDAVLGAASDIEKFRLECGASNTEQKLIGRRSGFRRDYGHLDILIHPQAPNDHFPEVLEWLRALL